MILNKKAFFACFFSIFSQSLLSNEIQEQISSIILVHHDLNKVEIVENETEIKHCTKTLLDETEDTKEMNLNLDQYYIIPIFKNTSSYRDENFWLFLKNYKDIDCCSALSDYIGLCKNYFSTKNNVKYLNKIKELLKMCFDKFNENEQQNVGNSKPEDNYPAWRLF